MATTKKALAKARTDGAKPNTREHKEQARIDAVAGELAARSDGPPMRLKMVDGVLQVTFTTRYAREDV